MKLLFIINPGAGNRETDYQRDIEAFFKDSAHDAQFYTLPKDCDLESIKHIIDTSNAERVVAVGGDGTVKLVAEALLKKPLGMGVIPAGSANGLAKELGIPLRLEDALQLSVQEKTFPVHVTQVNDHICIHLSDIGFNAFVVKKFEDEKRRGMWGYIKAAFKTLRDTPAMDVTITIGREKINRKAAMVVIANGTRYGSGAVINPEGRIDDSLFEIIIVRKVSFSEIFKMMVTHGPYDPEKTEVFQSSEAVVRSGKKAHFQVDGEYLGKVYQLKATLIPDALHVVVSEDNTDTPVSAINGK